jgi:hypothetical protein
MIALLSRSKRCALLWEALGWLALLELARMIGG